MRLFSCVVIFLGGLLTAGAKVEYNREVLPILTAKCLACHGPDVSKQKADLRLDDPGEAYRERDGLRVVVPGDPDQSELVHRIFSKDEDEVMPPPEEGTALTDDEKEILKKWISEGAEYERHWAFRSPVKGRPSDLKEGKEQVIDAFVQERLSRAGFQLQEEATREKLIRRVSIDLTGLPPSIEEVDAFVADQSQEAYRRVVDRLLGSPRYGERMAAWWLDGARYGDSHGYDNDLENAQWPWRNWIIESFNANQPYDQFVTWQLAGDLMPDASDDQIVATGFNRNHRIQTEGGAIEEEWRTEYVMDRVETMGSVFLGLTLSCARCHDHKYDPITQKDFYQMYAFFNNFDGAPETGGRSGPDFYRGLQPPYLDLPTDEQKLKLAELDRQIKVTQEKITSLKQLQAATGIPAAPDETSKPKPDLKPQIPAAEKQISDLKKQRSSFLRQVRGAMVMRERSEPKKTHIRVRGNYDQIGKEVTRDTPRFLPPLKKSAEVPSRMDLANWLVEKQNPLTARVAVNRFWQQLLGTGIVKTSEDFGAQGMWPSHPRLLDHLTLKFVESGWNIKKLMKDIVLTQTYQQSSAATSIDFKDDPENRLLARGSRTRLDSEVIRDQLLAVTGVLNREMGGRSVKTPQPAGIWKMVALPSSYPNSFQADPAPADRRRSIYTFWKRGLAPPQMTIFDAPSRDACIARRERTNTPLQALLLMNEPEYFKAAAHKATTLMAEEGSEDEKLIRLHETITTHKPSKISLKVLKEGLTTFREDGDDHFAWTMIVHTLLNRDSFKNKQ
ncbi:MAG TPA: chromosome segregation protein [Verrucomicrobiales bacterium]|nr:chromosome segregation protein [Verrucomicrobiales bacterium]